MQLECLIFMLCYKSENLFGHTNCMYLEDSRFHAGEDFSGEMIKA